MAKNKKESRKTRANTKEEKKEQKICFVIAPIGKPDSETRRRSDQVFKHIMEDAIGPLGYRLVRADHISEPGIITSQIIQYVVDSPLVIADLTGRNPNVFYELAIRHAIKRPLIQLIQAGEQIPFDVAGTRTIHVDVHDLDNVAEAKTELIKQVESIEKGKSEIDTPISVALDLKILKESANPEERSLADVVEAISELRSSMLSIEKRVKDPESLVPRGYLDYVFGRHLERMGTAKPRDLRRENILALRERHRLKKALDLITKKRVSAKDKKELSETLQLLIRRTSRRLQELRNMGEHEF